MTDDVVDALPLSYTGVRKFAVALLGIEPAHVNLLGWSLNH